MYTASQVHIFPEKHKLCALNGSYSPCPHNVLCKLYLILYVGDVGVINTPQCQKKCF